MTNVFDRGAFKAALAQLSFAFSQAVEAAVMSLIEGGPHPLDDIVGGDERPPVRCPLIWQQSSEVLIG
jgi:hypothetical protein